MKSRFIYLLFISFLTFPFTLSSQKAEVPAYLSHNQYMITYDGAYENDIVGTFDIWYPTKDTANGIFNFFLVDDENGTYDIDNNGTIYIKNNSKLLAGFDTLVVRTTLTNESIIYEDNYVYIKIKRESDCFFIDPSSNENGTGTRNSPFNNWKEITFTAGKTYLQKRGTKYNSDINITTNGSLNKEISFGAYGIGDRPIVSNPGGNGFIIRGSYLQIFEYCLKDNFIAILQERGLYQYNLFTDIVTINTSTLNGALYFLGYLIDDQWPSLGDYSWNTKVYDYIATDYTGYGIKIEGQGITVENAITNGGIQGISLTMASAFDTITGLLSFSNSEKQIEISGKFHDLSYSILRANGGNSCIHAEDSGSMGTKIRHCIIDGGNYFGGIALSGNGGGPPYYANNFIIENNEIINCPESGIWIAYNTKNVSIVRNKFHNCNTAIKIGANNVEIENIDIFYNLMFDNDVCIESVGGNNLNIIHNTIDGNIIFNNSHNVNVKCNYLKSSEGATIVENNINVDTINTSLHFIDYENHDYRLKSTAFSAQKKGIYIGITKDLNGTIVNETDNPDIGAYQYVQISDNMGENNEYTEPKDSVSNEPPNNGDFNSSPIIENQFFVLNQEELETNVFGEVIAYDPDSGQIIKFTILSGNESNIFKLESQSGIIEFTSESIIDIPFSSYSLLVKVEDNAPQIKSDTATIYITIEKIVNTVYIDPSNTSNDLRDGSKLHPFNSWQEVTWKPGYEYLQKKGTTSVEGKINILAEDVRIGSYGEGELPVISSSAKDYALRAYEKSNITIKDMHVIANDAISCIYFMGGSSDNNTIEGCVLEGAGSGVRIIEGNTFTVKYTTIKNTIDGIYSFAAANKIYYNIFRENQTAINISSYVSTADVFNNVFYGNTSGITTTYAELTLYNNIFYLVNAGDVAINHSMDKLVSDNNIFYPEHTGFVNINNQQYTSIYEIQSDLNIDLNSFSNDPGFVDIYNDNFMVNEQSPAIDAGKYVGISADFYGQTVPFGNMPDIGLTELMVSKTVTAIPEENKQTLMVYPNPSNGNFNIKFENNLNSDYSLKVTDIAGRTVFQENQYSTNYISNIDISGLPKGRYHLHLTSDEKTHIEQIIIQ
ncbi:MAG: right-handed parallel beta-helix repeat-containing protein [Bacteroidales bacterium]|nr:right-handed parallel beta-helix repeat-containing protein [Bacteroidales bacterium]